MDNIQFKKCPYPVGAFSGITIDGKTLVAGPLRCNSWHCPYCHVLLKRKLYRRIQQGIMALDVQTKYSRKFLTLTYGGSTKRMDSDPVQAYEEMSLAFHKLIKSMRHIYGHFHYFKVCELHKDGWPHFHVMLVGDNLAPMNVLDKLRYFWCERYGMGFIKINCVNFKGSKHATNYMLKYITKDIRKVGTRKRIFTASRDSLAKIEKIKWRETPHVYLGSDINNMLSRTITIYSDADVVMLEGWKHPCIKVGSTLIELRDYQDLMKNVHFNKLVS